MAQKRWMKDLLGDLEGGWCQGLNVQGDGRAVRRFGRLGAKQLRARGCICNCRGCKRRRRRQAGCAMNHKIRGRAEAGCALSQAQRRGGERAAAPAQLSPLSLVAAVLTNSATGWKGGCCWGRCVPVASSTRETTVSIFWGYRAMSAHTRVLMACREQQTTMDW